MKLLDEIRQQPEHIRHIFMWTMVVLSFSIIGFVWFQSKSRQVVALLNPEKAQQDEARNLAANDKSPSPFAAIGNSFKDLTANISALWKKSSPALLQNYSAITPVPPRPLPVK
ncbi:MAG: hypothetical protein A3A33_05040 [Candidatus Yanofskybacteria bacterium RIFCSPLOWO2_01_FULL_49_25]|uniref:Uncharacterized protein n=1 Tax=Candidatus Yanofskybacteria bacterium RIFCSPLOWO2_01_FULL_49_25 TaxID=1802701 RepID=A0A1F8GSD3_9BACT|nr:MAG: hypothetical protein A3A33_05040 [Candidatus Yanofskybacteria bacterium RIFCSPLOWO2_01_FULL_49_25]